MTPEFTTSCDAKRRVSIGVFAWNEEEAIVPALRSVFEQSLLADLSERGWHCELVCVVNGCTDHTPERAAEVFAAEAGRHPERDWIHCSVANLVERGKLNAWNQFVHRLSAKEAQYLFMMDADIIIHEPDTLRNMLRALEEDPEASISVDRPCKDLQFKPRTTWRERLSLAASQMTHAAEAQLCAQLYCIKAEVARSIYLPKDLAACEDGFIKALVCTDFLAHPVWPHRIRVAQGAGHIFEAYTRPADVLKNQKRQMIGQTIVHILVDDYLRTLTGSQRESLAETLKQKDSADPLWLKRLIAEHLRRRHFFWRLYPGLLSQRFRRLGKLSPARRLLCLPAAAAGFLVALVSSFLAYLTLKSGATNYWPRARRSGTSQS